jgi:hypothetical protein
MRSPYEARSRTISSPSSNGKATRHCRPRSRRPPVRQPPTTSPNSSRMDEADEGRDHAKHAREQDRCAAEDVRQRAPEEPGGDRENTEDPMSRPMVAGSRPSSRLRKMARNGMVIELARLMIPAPETSSLARNGARSGALITMPSGGWGGAYSSWVRRRWRPGSPRTDVPAPAVRLRRNGPHEVSGHSGCGLVSARRRQELRRPRRPRPR